MLDVRYGDPLWLKVNREIYDRLKPNMSFEEHVWRCRWHAYTIPDPQKNGEQLEIEFKANSGK